MKTLVLSLFLLSINAFSQSEIALDSLTASVLATPEKDTLFVKPDMYNIYVQVWQMEKDPAIKKPVIVSTPFVYQRATRQRKVNYEN